MRQVLIIHGGDSFSSYETYLDSLKQKQIDYERLKPHKSWKNWIAEQLPEVDVLLPSFPNSDNAVYEEWEIYFKKILPFLQFDDISIVGHSLGAMFLTKYLNDTPLDKPVRNLVLVSGGYDDETHEDIGSFRVESAKNLPRSAEKIHLFHSRDDLIVPFTELTKFQADIPAATTHVFEDRGHFLGETFPELLEILLQE